PRFGRDDAVAVVPAGRHARRRRPVFAGAARPGRRVARRGGVAAAGSAAGADTNRRETGTRSRSAISIAAMLVLAASLVLITRSAVALRGGASGGKSPAAVVGRLGDSVTSFDRAYRR